MNEEWRTIEGYEGLYEVSNLGRVRSLDMYVKCGYGNYRLHKGKVLSPTKDTNGYLRVVLSCNGKHKSITVHRLVAQTFILNPDNLPEVNHKDEDKTNNNVDNLEWCNRKYNINYGSRKDKVRDTKIKNGCWTGLRSGLSKKEYNHKYYNDNKNKIKDSQRSYYQENRDKIRDKQRTYYLKRKEQIQNNVH